MKQKFQGALLTLLIAIFTLSLGFISCKKNDIPGNKDQKDISRLYVSNADIDEAVANLDVYDDADTNPMLAVQSFTGAKDGNGVFVDQETDMLFQASRQKQSIYVFRNASTISANPTPKTVFTDNTLTSAREIAYDNSSKTLFVANNSDSSIRVYMNAPNLSGNVVGRKLKIPGEPWGIHYDASKDRLLVLIDKNGKRIEVYNNPSSIPAGNANPNSVLYVGGSPNGASTRLHGITYSSKLDILLVTEIGEPSAPAMPTAGKPAFNADGGIYIFENAAQKLTSGGGFKADRFIYGSNTGLGNPVDIAIDDVDQKQIYVAEKANKKILIFRLSDEGNQSPKQTISTDKLPEDIFLDIRKKTGNGKNY